MVRVKSYAVVLKFNLNHDKLGQFTSAPGGGGGAGGGKSLTASQAKAMDKLKAMPYPYQVLKRPGHDDVIVTGVNTTTLHSLKEKGLVNYTRVYLGGKVTPDFKITDGQDR